MHALGKDHSGLAYVRARVHKASTLSIIATTVALMLARPAYALFRKWLTNVWEKEYVIEVSRFRLPAKKTVAHVDRSASYAISMIRHLRRMYNRKPRHE